MKINVPEIEKILHMLKASTDTSLRAVQRSIVPHFHDLELTRVTRYVHDEVRHRSRKLLYRVDNISYIKDTDKIMMFDCNLLEAIQNKYIKPFALFMNGSMVNYSRIRIITDSRNTYLEIDGNIKFDIYKKFKNTNMNRQVHVFPKISELVIDNIRLDIYPATSVSSVYMNDQPVDNNSIIDPSILNTDKDNIVTFTTIGETSGVRIINKNVVNVYDIKGFGEQCIVFPDYTTVSKLDKNEEYPKGDIFLFGSDGLLINDKERYNQLNKPGGILFKYNNILNAEIKEGKTKLDGLINLDRHEDYTNSIDCVFGFDNGILVDNIKNYGGNIYKTNSNTFYKAYYYKEFKNVDNITRFIKMTDYMNHVLNGDNIEYVAPILDPMDFMYDQGKFKIDRIKEVVYEICKHNPNLLQEYIDSKSRVETKYYTTTMLKLVSNNEGTDYIYRMRRVPHGRTHGIGVMVFINGLLHDQKNVTYDDNYVYIRFSYTDLLINEYVEFMIFYDVFNGDIRVNYNKNKPEFLLSNYIPFEDIKVLTNDIYNHIYKSIPTSENLQYEIDNTLKDLGKGYIKLDFPDYYDGRDVSLSSRRKFIHEQYEIKDDELMIEKLYKILLSDKFKYCTNKGQFILFYNGRKISGRDAVICLNKWNLPFNKRFIHLNKKCEIGDIIDIYYVPEELKEVYFSEEIEERGYIHIKYDDLGYTLDGKNSSVFVNGRRVPSSDIESIGNDHARIISDTLSRKNVSVVKHIYHDDDIFQIMRTVESQWDKMIAGLSDKELDELFDFDIFLTDTEDNMRDNLYPDYMVLYEIIRRYWIEANDRANIENPLFYVERYDDGQNILRIDSSIYTLSVPRVLDKYVDTDSMNISINGFTVVPLDASNPFIKSNDIDHVTITYYNPNSIIIPNDSNILSSAQENIIDIIEKAVIDKNTIYKYAGSDHLKIDGTEELIDTLDIIDKYFYMILKENNIGNDSIFELDASRRFIEYKKLLEKPEFQKYFEDYITLVYVVDAAIEYMIAANLGAVGDIHVDANKLFPYYWDMRIAKSIDKDKSLVGVPIDSSLDSIIEIHNKAGE